MAWADAALPWIGLLLCVGLLMTVGCLWPLRLDLSVRARGTADGGWIVAGGWSLPLTSVAFVGGRGVRAQLSFLLFGRKISWKTHWSRRLTRPVPKRVKAASQRLLARVDLLSLFLQLVEERRHLRLRYLVVDLAYGFRDPLLTGRLVGALSMLSAVLPAPVELRQAPRWDFEDGWEVAVDGRALMKPWLILLDVAAYVVKRMGARPTTPSQPLGAESASQVR